MKSLKLYSLINCLQNSFNHMILQNILFIFKTVLVGFQIVLVEIPIGVSTRTISNLTGF